MKEILLITDQYKLRKRETSIVLTTLLGEEVQEVAMGMIDSISVFGNVQLSTQLLKSLSKEGIEVYFFSKSGGYLAHVESSYKDNSVAQRHQARATDDFYYCLAMSKKIISAKIRHSKELLLSYNEDGLLDEEDFQVFEQSLVQIEEAKTISEVLGFEGKCAKSYFYYLGFLVPNEFRFKGRSKRPPKDLFNAFISFGYANLYKYLVGAIRRHGLLPSFGIVHQDKPAHASLASDLMEEWRSILVDDVVMRLLREEVITKEDYTVNENGGIYLENRLRTVFLQRLSQRMNEAHPYLFSDKKRYDFFYAVDQQVNALKRSFEEKDVELFHTIGEGKDEVV
ncbi:CRISP-associated protein Cas1 [Pilibacter termitis]|uniref:CRISPR-associated endonuclease Cas1 n=1 Tax=Pilibacter termitis TaxID=263852 RepID=A0A1T4NCT7_9ENTE|nr:CRISPR-associated endonuclease Cas1 [Pilibacter termitis]SJZ76933.1 CRISP-associated protein Cas1 [Pilibacter termitis]